MTAARSRTKPRTRRSSATLADGTVAFVYLRISVFADLATERQDAAARQLCAARGWPVAATYSDEGVSAYNGAERPGFDRMLADAAAHPGPVVLVAWDLDRLVRRVAEVGRLIDLYETHGVPFVTVQGGVDLTSAAGKLIAYVLTAVAEMESEHKAERLRLRYEQNRERGVPHWIFRPFGFRRDDSGAWAHDEDEAVSLRAAYERFIGGDTLAAVADAWNAEGITQPERTDKRTGDTIRKAWHYSAVRKLLRSERNAGLMPDGTTGAWDPIVPAETFARAVHLLDANADTYAGHGNGNAVRHLLAGMLVCDACDSRMTSHKRSNGGRSYLCRRDRGGCGVTITADGVDEEVTGRVLAWLENPANRAALEIPADEDDDGGTYAATVRACAAKREELLAMIDPALGVTKADVAPALLAVKADEEAATARLRTVRASSPAVFLPTEPVALREDWKDATVPERRAVIGDVLEPVRILPSTKAGRGFDPARIVWAYRYPVAA